MKLYTHNQLAARLVAAMAFGACMHLGLDVFAVAADKEYANFMMFEQAKKYVRMCIRLEWWCACVCNLVIERFHVKWKMYLQCLFA